MLKRLDPFIEIMEDIAEIMQEVNM